MLTLQLAREERGMRLDFDCYRQGSVPVDGVMGVLDEVHGVIEQAFFDLVTKEYLAYMKGGS